MIFYQHYRERVYAFIQSARVLPATAPAALPQATGWFEKLVKACDTDAYLLGYICESGRKRSSADPALKGQVV